MQRRRLLLVWLTYLAAVGLSVNYLVSLYSSRDSPEAATAHAGSSNAEAAVNQRCSLPVAARSASPVMDVWIVAGQSNAVGDNWRDPNPLPDASAPAGEAILAWTPDGRWAAAQPSIHFGVHNFTMQDSVGPDMSFARTLITEGIASRVALIPTAKCNTDLAADWYPGTGPYYTHMIQTVNAAMQAASGSDWEPPRLAGLIWVQGESDAVPATSDGAPTKADAYPSNLRHFITSVRSDLAAFNPCLPIILGVMSDRQTSDKLPHIHTIRQHQLDLDQPSIIKVDLDRHAFYRQNGVTLHLSKQGQGTFGVAMAVAYKVWWSAQMQQQQQ